MPNTANTNTDQRARICVDMGKRISSKLVETGMTKTELADAIGVTASAVSHYLIGDRVMPPDKIRNAAVALETTTDYLLGLDDVVTTNMQKGQTFVYDLELDDKMHPTLTATKPVVGNYQLSHPEACVRLLEDNFKLSDKAEEYLYLICTTVKNQPTAVFEVSHGSQHYAELNIANLMRRILLSGGSAILLAHNHPSGDPSPSEHDFETTKKVASVSRQLGILLNDHVIIAKNGYYSIRQLVPELFACN